MVIVDGEADGRSRGTRDVLVNSGWCFLVAVTYIFCVLSGRECCPGPWQKINS